MPLSEGKIKHLNALSNKKGVIAAAAMDQRGSLRKSIASAKGCPQEQVTDEMMSEFKVAVSKVLTPHASAILLDPEFGLPAAKARSKTPACCSLTKKAATTIPSPAVCPTFCRTSPSSALWIWAPMPSKSSSTTRLSIPPT